MSSAPYFLATKIEAFKDRGKQDFLLSHDLEDIISLIDGRPEIMNDVSDSLSDLKQYLSLEFSAFIHNNQERKWRMGDKVPALNKFLKNISH